MTQPQKQTIEQEIIDLAKEYLECSHIKMSTLKEQITTLEKGITDKQNEIESMQVNLTRFRKRLKVWQLLVNKK